MAVLHELCFYRNFCRVELTLHALTICALFDLKQTTGGCVFGLEKQIEVKRWYDKFRCFEVVFRTGVE